MCTIEREGRERGAWPWEGGRARFVIRSKESSGTPRCPRFFWVRFRDFKELITDHALVIISTLLYIRCCYVEKRHLIVDKFYQGFIDV